MQILGRYLWHERNFGPKSGSFVAVGPAPPTQKNIVRAAKILLERPVFKATFVMFVFRFTISVQIYAFVHANGSVIQECTRKFIVYFS